MTGRQAPEGTAARVLTQAIATEERGMTDPALVIVPNGVIAARAGFAAPSDG
jgi:hypothetical protein